MAMLELPPRSCGFIVVFLSEKLGCTMIFTSNKNKAPQDRCRTICLSGGFSGGFRMSNLHWGF
ncbi:MAG: hypothetical protein DID91_2727704795 [Candidatus Nitrotoga sp. MKT]|nr:MAG: hypothetical protein DID91_2727704795 [Candidatus Nitrotoga sp. MKT]